MATHLRAALTAVVLLLTVPVPAQSPAEPVSSDLSVCAGLEPEQCAELTRLVAELSELAEDEERWTAVPTRSPTLEAITEAAKAARLVDEDRWPADSNVTGRLVNALKSALEEHVDRRNKEWEDEYFEHLRWYNAARTYRHDLEAITAERTALETSLRHAENRIRILEGLFFQSIAGIGTGVVVMGHETWTERHTIIDFRNRIVEDLGRHAGRNGGAKLVFSYSEVADGTLLTDLVEEYRGGRVEAFESDPYCISDRSEHYCVQMFRVFPEIVRSGGATPSQTTDPGMDAAQTVDASIVDSLSDPRYLNSYLALSSESQALVGNMLDRVSAYNRRSVSKLSEIEQKYRREISANQAHRSALEERLHDNTLRHEALVRAVDTDIAAEHEAVRSRVGGTSLSERVSSWVRLRAELLDSFLSHRDYIAYTVRREFLHAGQLSDDLREVLVKDALEKLEERRRHFLTRRFARVDAGVLQDYTVEEYYQEGQIVSFFLPLYLRSYPHRVQGGGTETQESLLLAMRIAFDQRRGGPRPTPLAGSAPQLEEPGTTEAPTCEPSEPEHRGRLVPCADERFVLDRDTGLIWALGALEEHVLYRQFERRTELLTGLGSQRWRLPTADELRGLVNAFEDGPGLVHGMYWTDSSRGSGMDVRVTTVHLPSGAVDERAADNIANGLAVLDGRSR